MTKRLVITAQGGTQFSARIEEGESEDYLGRFAFGTLDEDGQYEQDDDEIVQAARERFGLDSELPAVVF